MYYSLYWLFRIFDLRVQPAPGIQASLVASTTAGLGSGAFRVKGTVHTTPRAVAGARSRGK